MEQMWYTTRSAASYLSLSERSIRSLLNAGKLKFSKPAGKILIHKKWLDAWALSYGKKLTPSQNHEVESLNYPEILSKSNNQIHRKIGRNGK